MVADHLSRLVQEYLIGDDEIPLRENFPDEHLWAIQGEEPWYADLVNYLTHGVLPTGLNWQGKKRFIKRSREYFWDEPYLFKHGPDHVIRRCVPEVEKYEVLRFCHEFQCGGHFSARTTALKVLGLCSIARV